MNPATLRIRLTHIKNKPTDRWNYTVLQYSHIFMTSNSMSFLRAWSIHCYFNTYNGIRMAAINTGRVLYKLITFQSIDKSQWDKSRKATKQKKNYDKHTYERLATTKKCIINNNNKKISDQRIHGLCAITNTETPSIGVYPVNTKHKAAAAIVRCAFTILRNILVYVVADNEYE